MCCTVLLRYKYAPPCLLIIAQVISGKSMRVLMISTEYPPMNGGVGRYTANLTKSLRKYETEIILVCNEKGKGDIGGISPSNEQNSNILWALWTKLNRI